jgi:transcriptional regulator with XRE-family HTH domain
MSDLGQRIRLERKRLGISQRELAELVGVHQTMISGIESGERNPSVKLLADLQSHFGVILLPVVGTESLVEVPHAGA